MIDFTPIFRRLGLLDDEPDDFTLYRKPLPSDSADVVIARINGREDANGTPRKEAGVNKNKFSVVVEHLQKGMSNGAIERATGIDFDTVGKYRRKWEADNGAKLRCLCGREAGHNGWCPARLTRSVRRQEFLRQRWGRLKSVI